MNNHIVVIPVLCDTAILVKSFFKKPNSPFRLLNRCQLKWLLKIAAGGGGTTFLLYDAEGLPEKV
jgi:hypothetical protein